MFGGEGQFTRLSSTGTFTVYDSGGDNTAFTQNAGSTFQITTSQGTMQFDAYTNDYVFKGTANQGDAYVRCYDMSGVTYNVVWNDGSNCYWDTSEDIPHQIRPNEVNKFEVTSSSVTILDLYRLPEAVGTEGQRMVVDSGGNVNFEHSTHTVTLKKGGDVYKADSTFIPIPGMWENVGSTITITAVQFYTHYASTVAATKFNIAKSTGSDSGAGRVPTYTELFSSDVSVAVNTARSVWTAPNTTTVNADEAFAVHITSVAETGDRAAEYGCTVRYWIQEIP
jgi:hypothetical protein